MVLSLVWYVVALFGVAEKIHDSLGSASRVLCLMSSVVQLVGSILCGTVDLP